VLLTPDVWEDLQRFRGAAPDDAPVFTSQQHGTKGDRKLEKRLSPDQVYRIVRNAAEEALGKGRMVSPHWFRHAHASHALDNGAPITLVCDTLGHRNLTTTSRSSHARPNASSGQYLKG
jgi:integrase/recombinase XerD